jgi:hypothetical protein
MTRARLLRAEALLVAAVVAHTLAVGLVLVAVPAWGLRFGGWTSTPPLFFPRQAGVFHFAVGFGYALEFLRGRGVTLLVFTKSLAVVFLTTATALGAAPWLVPASAAADAAMAAAVLLVHRAAVGGAGRAA